LFLKSLEATRRANLARAFPGYGPIFLKRGEGLYFYPLFHWAKSILKIPKKHLLEERFLAILCWRVYCDTRICVLWGKWRGKVFQEKSGWKPFFMRKNRADTV